MNGATQCQNCLAPLLEERDGERCANCPLKLAPVPRRAGVAATALVPCLLGAWWDSVHGESLVTR